MPCRRARGYIRGIRQAYRGDRWPGPCRRFRATGFPGRNGVELTDRVHRPCEAQTLGCAAVRRPDNGTKRAQIGKASGYTHRSFRPDAVRYMYVDTATRRPAVTHPETRRDKKETARRAAFSAAQGPFSLVVAGVGFEPT